MKKTTEEIIAETRAFVQASLKDAEAGHDWWHIQRVYTTAMELTLELKASKLIVALASLLHDVGDAKFHDGDESVGPKIIGGFLKTQNLDFEDYDHIMYIIEHMSFRKSASFSGDKTIEFQIVQDADRLDSIGAIGIARAFSFGGYKGRPFYDPDSLITDKAENSTYQSGKAPTINHFYEKLLLLKDQMNTSAGLKRAQLRHQYMLGFLEQFYQEWKGVT